MAGAGGFEPPHAGTKTRCLTAWRRPMTHDPLPIIHEGKINGALRVFNPCSAVSPSLSVVDNYRLDFKDRIHKK